MKELVIVTRFHSASGVVQILMIISTSLVD